MGQRVFEFGILAARAHDHVVGRRPSVGHVLAGEVGQRDDHGVEFGFRLAELFVQFARGFLEGGRLAFGRFGFLPASLFEEHAHFLGHGVLLSQQFVQLSLNRLAFVVQPFDLLDRFGGVHAFDGETFEGERFVFPDLL